MIKQLIRMNHTKQILEIGTAIGYSSMQFASVASDIEVTTIERNEDMLAQARHHFQEYHYEEQIRLIEGDALEMYDSVSDRLYDMIFIDAKSTIKNFSSYTRLY